KRLLKEKTRIQVTSRCAVQVSRTNPCELPGDPVRSDGRHGRSWRALAAAPSLRYHKPVPLATRTFARPPAFCPAPTGITQYSMALLFVHYPFCGLGGRVARAGRDGLPPGRAPAFSPRATNAPGRPRPCR